MKWRPPSLSELTPIKFNTGLTHLGLEASIFDRFLKNSKKSVLFCIYPTESDVKQIIDLFVYD